MSRGYSRSLSMEYIPDGVSKAQWEIIKKKEAEANKGKNLGAVGITKFKSRSFEAFQKSGSKNLFPVSPDTPMEQRPYMQRPGGMPDGSDLKKKGLFAQAQAAMPKMAKEVDAKYDKLEKEGKLTSSPWAANMPWTNQGAAAYKTPLMQEKDAAAKALKASVAAKKSVGSVKGVSGKKVAAAPVEEPKKKGFFGLF